MKHEPRYRIRCPVHGFIVFSEQERLIIDHRYLQRLRHVHQLGLTMLLFPGASHSRFEHSLGVMEAATRVFDHLIARHGDRLREALFGCADLREAPLIRTRQLLRLAALTHDVGHPCFSHGTEAVLCPGGHHERLTIWALRESDLGERIDRAYWPGCAARVAQLLTGESLEPDLRWLRGIISSQLDADRTDYLRRDSHHCGVEYGIFDAERLIACLELADAEGGGLELALARDGLHTYEALILARYQMTTQIYHHRVRRVYDHYLRQWLLASGAAGQGPESVLASNDCLVLAALYRDHDDPAAPPERRRWASRVITRQHHRVVFATDNEASEADVARLEQVAAGLGAAFPEALIFGDVASGNVHDGGRSLPLVGGGRGRGDAGESRMLQAIPPRYRCARIFAAVDAGPEREAIASAAAAAWRQHEGDSTPERSAAGR